MSPMKKRARASDGGENENLDWTKIALRANNVRVRLIGTSPLIMHRLSEKARKELFYPSPQKTKADKQSTMKHDPLVEYQQCFYRNRDDHTPTYFHLPQGMVKGALTSACKRLPGAVRTEVQALVQITSPSIFIYGIPRLAADIVRQGGMTKTPDIRIRPYFERWCAEVDLTHIETLIPQIAIERLLLAGGMFVGLGDWRPEKNGSNGRYRLTETEVDAEWDEIVAEGGRDAQVEAFAHPEYFNEETEELMEWFFQERIRRTTGKRGAPVLPPAHEITTLDKDGDVVGKQARPRKGNGGEITA